jgi:CheY-like chemotaxis protein
VRAFVIAQLQSPGYKTLTAANAAEALEIVDGGAAFDLLFTDVIMPGKMNGRQLAQEPITSSKAGGLIGNRQRRF